MGSVARINIAIDGFAGSGKTTVAIELAQRLGVVYLDTGLMYRAVALQCLRTQTPAEQATDLLPNLDLQIKVENRPHPVCRMILSGEDVTDLLHDPQVSRLVPPVATLSPVRRELVARQQAFARNGGVVMVGRDIASVVLPNAELKVFLDADLAERARRRYLEFQQQGKNLSQAEVEADLASRDKTDSERADSPLVCTEDARRLDSTGLSIAQVVEQIASWSEAIEAKTRA